MHLPATPIHPGQGSKQVHGASTNPHSSRYLQTLGACRADPHRSRDRINAFDLSLDYAFHATTSLVVTALSHGHGVVALLRVVVRVLALSPRVDTVACMSAPGRTRCRLGNQARFVSTPMDRVPENTESGHRRGHELSAAYWTHRFRRARSSMVHVA